MTKASGYSNNMPDRVRHEIDDFGLTLFEQDTPKQSLNAAHIFMKERAILEQHLTNLRHLMDPAG